MRDDATSSERPSTSATSGGSGTIRWTVLGTALTLAIILNLVLLGAKLIDLRLPGNHEGFEPVQPIAFSHRLHGGELKIPCLYCHSHAARGRYAGTPAPQLCLNCHRFVRATLGAVRAEEAQASEENREPERITSEELGKLYDALGLDSELVQQKEPSPIRWIKVHNLPDFVYFDHSAHEAVGIDCSRCHGKVEAMERVRQYETLSMGWCVNCHRETSGQIYHGRKLAPSLDCSACHF